VDAPPPAFRRFRVLVVSHRDPMPPHWSTSHMADDLAHLIRARVEGPVIIVGHSMGGMVAQHLAGANPELVDRMVLSSTLPSSDPVFNSVLERWERLLREEDWRGFYRDAIDSSFVGTGRLWRRAALRLSSEHEPDGELVERHLALSAACRTHDATHLLGDVTAATLVANGTEDVLTRPERARELVRALPHARLALIDGAGHGLPDQRRRAYAREIRGFLREGAP
jgi:3-oxoadipate enol-lactonase